MPTAGSGNLTDLTGTTWYFNYYSQINFSLNNYNINFTSADGQEFKGISGSVSFGELWYTKAEGGTTYIEGGWTQYPELRTIYITGGTDATNTTLITWLYDNATFIQHDIEIKYNDLVIASLDDSGTKTLLTAGKYCQDNIVVDYTKPTPNLQSKSASPTTSSQTITADSGYDGLSQVTVNAISPTKSAQTYTPTTTDQTIASGRWLTGAQTIKGDANLVASNIASGVSIFGVTGTHSGGGSNEDLNKIITRTITSVTNSEVGYVGSFAFANCTSLTTASFPSCQVISSSAFYQCSKLTTISFPSCIFIYSFAFGYCYSLASVNFPSCQSIGNYAFTNCISLSTIDFPVCKTVGSYAFTSCSSLTIANFPSCSSIGNYAFSSCSKLATVNFPIFSSSIGTGTFMRCYSLTTASFPSCTGIGYSAFHYCSKLTTISFPSCSSIGSNAFYSCSGLSTIDFPVCKTVGSYAFGNCYSLTTASFPSCVSLYNSAFANCYNLTSLYLTGSSVAGLINSTAFNSTPIAGYTTSTGGIYGSIFVPSSLYNTYISSTNWVYFSSRFVSV